MTNATQLLAKIAQQKEEIEAIQQYWASIFPTFEVLPPTQAKVWLDKFPFECVVAGIDAMVVQANKRLQAKQPMTAEEAMAYASAAMRDSGLTDEQRAAKHAERVESGRRGGKNRARNWRQENGYKQPDLPLTELDGASNSLTEPSEALPSLERASTVSTTVSTSCSCSCSCSSTFSDSNSDTTLHCSAADAGVVSSQSINNEEQHPDAKQEQDQHQPQDGLVAGYTPEEIAAKAEECKDNGWVKANDSPSARKRPGFVKHLMENCEPPKRVPRPGSHADRNPGLHTGFDADGKRCSDGAQAFCKTKKNCNELHPNGIHPDAFHSGNYDFLGAKVKQQAARDAYHSGDHSFAADMERKAKEQEAHKAADYQREKMVAAGMPSYRVESGKREILASDI